MKEIKGKSAKIYKYVGDVLNAISEYYGYNYVKADVTSSDIRKITYNSDFSYSFMITNDTSIYDDAEFISMFYRIIEELRIEEASVKINYNKYDIKTLSSYLDELEVNYENIEANNIPNIIEFEVSADINNKEITLAKGIKNIDSLKGTIDIDKLLDILDIIYEDRDFTSISQVTIIGESEEEKIRGMKLAQDLRWCEIKVDFEPNKTKIEQLKNVKSNLSIVLEDENLKKGLIKVIDNLTKDEQIVDEAEIIDYIVSNI